MLTHTRKESEAQHCYYWRVFYTRDTNEQTFDSRKSGATRPELLITFTERSELILNIAQTNLNATRNGLPNHIQARGSLNRQGHNVDARSE